MRGRKDMEKVLRDKRMLFLFVAPSLIIFVMVLLIPIFGSIGLSFYSWDVISNPKFIGLANYRRMFTTDRVFGIAFRNSLFFVMVSLISQQVLGLTIAVILTSGVRLRNFFKNVYYLPCVLSASAVGLMWGFIFNPGMGVINNFLALIGAESLQRQWLVTSPLSLWCIAFVAMWQYMGTTMMLYMSSIQGIPASIYEAAAIDGASKAQCVFRITIPLVRPMIKISTVLCCVGSLKFFDLIYTMTNGGPNNQTEVLASHLYRRSFQMFEYGYGNAIAVILLGLCLVFTIAVDKAIKVENYEM